MWWLAVLFAVLLLGLVPIGLLGVYDPSGPRALLIIGAVRIPIYPKRCTRKVRSKSKRSKKNITVSHDDKKPVGTNAEFAYIVKTILRVLGELWRRLQVDVLELKILLAQEDPSDLAINYARTWTAVGNLIPQLERFCNIKKRIVDVSCDFTGGQTQIFAKLQVSITVGRAIALLVKHGIQFLKNDLQSKNTRKGGAEL